MELVCVARCANELGEGPLWDATRGRLYWVDINAKTIFWLDPDSNITGSWCLPLRVSALAMRGDDTLLLATDHGFATFDPADARIQIRFHPEPERARNRPNDGHADVKGRFWLGTMDDEGRNYTGAIYRLDADWSCTRVLDGLGIPNTVLCSRDGGTFYMADSKSRELFRFTIDASGAVNDRRVLARLDKREGAPDGSALDEHGYLWNAQWGGRRIVRYTPDGVVDRVLDVPVDQPTSCAFGGPNLRTLYITTARTGLSSEALAQQPWAGALLACQPGVRGVPTACFGG